MKKTIVITAMLLFASGVALAFKPLYTVSNEDLPHMPLLVNYTKLGDTISFTILFQKTGVFHNVWSPSLSLCDSKGEIVFRGELATSGSMTDPSVTEIRFEAKADSLAKSTFSLHAATRGHRSVVYVFPLSLLVDRFKGHKEDGDLEIGAETNPVKQYFKTKRDPKPVLEKIDAVWDKAEKGASNN
jgi:hypothetical protein